MSNATAFLEGYIADYLIANGGYMSLHTGDPTAGNEVTGGSYTRSAVAFAKSGSEPTALTNTGIVEFPVATVAWGNITHAAIQSAAVAGNMLVKFPVAVAKTIGIGDVARFLIGDIDITVN